MMPRGDQTGPQGGGSMTGRRLGRCTGNDNRSFEPGYGTGFGGGRRGGSFAGRRGASGRGFGQGNGYGYGARFQRTGVESDQGADIQQLPDAEKTILSQQLTTVIDQLSKLLEKSADSGMENDEKE